MKLFVFAVALAILQAVAAHTVFTTLFMNDVDQGDGTCVRMPMTPSNATFPVNDLESSAMACGYDGTAGVPRVCSANRASQLTFQFREYADNSYPGALDPSHKGPCAVYMKSVQSAIDDPAVGAGWFKIWDEGYDSKSSKWCTEKLIANDGYLSVDIPDDLAGGYYLVRPELLALHQADKTPPNPQFYVGCAQIFLNSTGAAHPAQTVSIPGYVNINDPSVLFNIYTPKWPYPMPGPTPYVGGSSPAIKIKAALRPQTQSEGLLPGNAILTNANWWGVELDPYTTATGCWNASAACYAQCKTCYDTAPPTGSQNCRIWEAKCDGIQNACSAGNLTGPPLTRTELVLPLPTIIYSTEHTTLPEPEPTHLTTGTVSDNPATSFSQIIVSMPTTTTSSAKLPMPTQMSRDGKCGLLAEGTWTCLGSFFGDCCSAHGWCGLNDLYCGMGCQSRFGSCANVIPSHKLKHRHQHRHGHLHHHQL